jgi:uncharacterized membrane protein
MATDTAMRSEQQQPKRELSRQTSSTNVGMDERHVSLMLGGALAALGLFRLRPMSLLLGSGLIYRGMTGHCSAYQALGIDTNEN